MFLFKNVSEKITTLKKILDWYYENIKKPKNISHRVCFSQWLIHIAWLGSWGPTAMKSSQRYHCLPEMFQFQYQGWGLLKQYFPFQYFPNFSASPKYMLAIEYHTHIWQVSLQLSCGDTCQIWMWCKEFNRYFARIEIFAYGEINEWSFSNPHPRRAHTLRPEVKCHYPTDYIQCLKFCLFWGVFFFSFFAVFFFFF